MVMPLRKAKLKRASPRRDCNRNRKLVVGKFAVHYFEISSEKTEKYIAKTKPKKAKEEKTRELERLKTVNRKIWMRKKNSVH